MNFFENEPSQDVEGFLNSILSADLDRKIICGEPYNVTLERGINPHGEYELNVSQDMDEPEVEWVGTYYYDNAEDREHDADLLENFISINYV